MANRLLTVPLLCVLAAGAAHAQEATSSAEPAPASRALLVQRLDESFARVDSNRDGSVDRSEIEALELKVAEELRAGVQKRLAEQFARLDKDRSGQLSLAEFQAGAAVKATPKPDAAMQRLDSNKDGKVNPDEYKARKLAEFDSLDSNKDGTLSADEQRKALGR